MKNSGLHMAGPRQPAMFSLTSDVNSSMDSFSLKMQDQHFDSDSSTSVMDIRRNHLALPVQ
jgi:hypothetical protein